jgi:hypothetical protein
MDALLLFLWLVFVTVVLLNTINPGLASHCLRDATTDV